MISEVYTEAAVFDVAKRLLAAVCDTPRSGAALILLRGDLGAGKTTLTKALAATLGVTETVTSPTFVVMRSYETAHESFTRLVHIDAYRIEAEAEVAVLRIPELFTDPETLIVIEWPERIPNTLANVPVWDCTITMTDETDRTLTGSYSAHVTA